MSRKTLIIIGFATLIGFPIAGYILTLFAQNDFNQIFNYPEKTWIQLPIGLVLGSIFGFISTRIIGLNFMKEVREKYQNMIYPLKMDTHLIIFLSFSAGFGEEIFFRGSLQPIIGNILTTLIFVAIHGYLSFINFKIFLYGLYLCVFIWLVGFSFEFLGIWTAIAAHAIYDFILFKFLSKPLPQEQI